MGKKATAIVCILVLTVLAGCKNAGGEESTVNQGQAGRFDYGLEEVIAFAADQDGSVYAAFRSQREIKKYNGKGELLGTYDLGEGEHTLICILGDCLFSFTFQGNGYVIQEYDLQKGTLVSYPVEECPSSADAMCVTDTDFYLIVCDEMSDTEDIERYDENDGYYSMGEKVLRISRADNTLETVGIPHVIAMNKKEEDMLCFYAYDEEGGYYFQDYNWKTNTFGEKIYNNQFGYAFSFALYQDQAIVSRSTGEGLAAAAITDESVRADFYDQAFVYKGNALQVVGDDCYLLNSFDESVERLDLRVSIIDNQPIVCYAPEIYLTVPHGCGYRIEADQLTDDEFALSVLAGNSDYDICMMDTSQTFSRNMRDQGAYYPLNDVPGVQEYLDSCHDYIREAATNENGQIWMIPVKVEVPCFLYQDQSCKEIGIDFSSVKTYEDILQFMETAYAVESCRGWYSTGGYWHQALLSQYIANYGIADGRANFDTELFRMICSFLKELDYDRADMNMIMKSVGEAGSMESYYEQYLFEYDDRCIYTEQEEVRFQYLSGAPLPQLEEGASCPGVARCFYFSVNQNSGNLKNTLQYVSAFCDYMTNRKDTCMQKEIGNWLFPDTKLTADLYEIYADNTIYFELSYEMFWEDYLRYRKDEITLDAFIGEVERKVDMYLNE